MPKILFVNPVNSISEKGENYFINKIISVSQRGYTRCVVNPLQSDPDFADASHILEEKLHVCMFFFATTALAGIA